MTNVLRASKYNEKWSRKYIKSSHIHFVELACLPTRLLQGIVYRDTRKGPVWKETTRKSCKTLDKSSRCDKENYVAQPDPFSLVGANFFSRRSSAMVVGWGAKWSQHWECGVGRELCIEMMKPEVCPKFASSDLSKAVQAVRLGSWPV